MKVLLRFDTGDWIKPLLGKIAGTDLKITLCSEKTDEDYLAHMRDSDVLWHVLKPVTAAVIKAAPKLKLIQKLGTGVNTIDLAAAATHKVAVCNMPGRNSRAVAEMTLLLMLATLRKLNSFDQLMRQGEGWHWPNSWQEGLGEIHGRTIGLVGFGAVSRLLAPILVAMGATVIYTGRQAHVDVPYPYVSKAELLARSDIISLHMPLVPETTGWLDRASIAQMRNGAVVINVARGALIDEQALLEGLKSQHIAAAGLDVFSEEPISPQHPFLHLSNVVLTPHIAWLTSETIARSLTVAAANCRRLGEGSPLLHQVV